MNTTVFSLGGMLSFFMILLIQCSVSSLHSQEQKSNEQPESVMYQYTKHQSQRKIRVNLMLEHRRKANQFQTITGITFGLGIGVAALNQNPDTYFKSGWAVAAGLAGAGLISWLQSNIERSRASEIESLIYSEPFDYRLFNQPTQPTQVKPSDHLKDIVKLTSDFNDHKIQTIDLIEQRMNILKAQNEELKKELAVMSEEIRAQPTKSVVTPNVAQTTYTPSVAQVTQLPFREIQFVATSGGQDYSELSYLGQVVSEQVGSTNIFRYKIVGRFDDAKVSEVINKLLAHGFKGAFEKK